MTDHSNATDMLNKSQREAAYWRERCEWQSIETAPKDATILWVADQHSMCPAYWAGDEEKCWRNWFNGNRYEYVHLGTDAYLPEPIWFSPTDWMPLPAPPENITPENNDG